MTLTVALHVGQLLQPVPGGIGTYVRELMTNLPTHDVVGSTFAAGPAPDGAPGYTELGRPGGALRYEAWLRFRRPTLPLTADVVHGPSLAVPPRRTRSGAAALVVTVHDVAFLRYPEYFTDRGVTFHRRGLDVARRDADVIITPSEFTRTELGREGFDLNRIVAIPHGITAPPRPDNTAIEQTLSELGITTPFILAVGTVEPRKGFDVAARAVAALNRPDVRLVIVGPDGWNEVPDLNHPNVLRVGAVSDAVRDTLYAAAELTVVPSHYEGFGLPALEAMARGSAVIASNTSSLPEVVADAGVLVNAGDDAAWADAIGALLDDPNRRAELEQAGRERTSVCTWERAVASHVDVYRHAAERHGRTTS